MTLGHMAAHATQPPTPEHPSRKNSDLIAVERLAGGDDVTGAVLYTLTSGTFGTVPPRGGPPLPSSSGPSLFGPCGFLRAPGLRFARTRFSGIFSALGVIGPSRNSKPSLLLPSSSLISMTRTWLPSLSLLI